MTVLTDAGREYLARHAIDPLVLAQLGVTEQAGRLILPNGRSTALNGGATKVLQPAGKPLALWWPTGPPVVGHSDSPRHWPSVPWTCASGQSSTPVPGSCFR